MRRLLVLATAVALALPLGAPLASAAGATARASLTDIENDVMCVSCREPLSVAQSPQALAERNFVRMLIARGLSKRQVEAALVAQYGPAVLGRPPADGFNLTVYILPPALVVLGIVLLVVTLPRWRRRSRAAATRAAADVPAELPAEEAQRLERELASFDG